MIKDLVNLRPGHRFRGYASSESRLAYGLPRNLRLERLSGIPQGRVAGRIWGRRDGGFTKSSEIPAGNSRSSDLHSGDIERVEIEWKSLLSLIAYAPVLPLARWQELQQLAKKVVGENDVEENLPELPELLSRQKERFESNSGTVI